MALSEKKSDSVGGKCVYAFNRRKAKREISDYESAFLVVWNLFFPTTLLHGSDAACGFGDDLEQPRLLGRGS
jgi:hypothetical protein